MSRRRTLTVLLSLTIAGAAATPPSAWRLGVVPTLHAAQTTGSTVSPARAAPFIGDWTSSITSEMGPMTFAVSVKIESGKVVATVSGGMFPTATVSDISLVGQNLFLKYVNELPGMSIPGLVAMTPQEPNMLLTISLMDGQFEMAGTATKGRPGGRDVSAAGGGQTVRGGTPAAQAGGRGPVAQPQVARVTDLMQMMSALPESAPAVPKQPRTVLVLARAAGFVHSSIPLAARTIEALGQKTGAWNTVITYTAADINEQNLQRYDAVFLASTTGLFLDDLTDQAVTASRRKALLDFVRGGKGIAGIHAATDSYHGAAPGEAPAMAPGARPPVDGGKPLWPEFNQLIGGYFKYHWLYPTQIAVKIDDPESPVNAAFTSLNKQTGVRLPRPFSVVDEVYTFNEASWSRGRTHVLTSIDYAKMPAEIKAQEPAPQRADHDYALSYLQREGKGRVFVQVLGHDESIYKIPSMLAHILAGVQYALGDLQADDSPTNPAKP